MIDEKRQPPQPDASQKIPATDSANEAIPATDSDIERGEYDGGLFRRMICDLGIYRDRLLPKVINEMVHSQPPKLDSEEATRAMELIYAEAQRLWGKAQATAYLRYYYHYAQEKGLTTKDWQTYQLTLNEKRLKYISELSYGEQRDWHTFLDNDQPSRETAMDILQEALRVRLPSVKYIFEPTAQHLHAKMTKAEYQIVMKIFPDLTDEEAKKIYGQLTSAEDVRQKSLE